MNFSNFVRKILLLGNIPEKHLSVFLSKKGIKLFQCAFTHKSYDSRNNYEYLELLGDATSNNAISHYIPKRFPKIQNVILLTKIRHNLVSKTSFSEISNKYGFYRHIRVSESYRDKFLRPVRGSKMNNTEYRTLLEDVLEAFFGALNILAIEEIKNESPYISYNYVYTYNILEYILDGTKIGTRYEDIYDPMSRLKSYYDQKGWDISKLKKSGKTNATFYDPDGKVLGYYKGTDALNQAALYALRTLKDERKVVVGFKNTSEPPAKSDILQRDGFKDFIKGLLRKSCVKSSKLDFYTTPKMLKRFETAFNYEPSKKKNFPYQLNKYNGDMIVDNVIVYYSRIRLPHIKHEGWISKLKHYLMKNRVLGKYAERLGFEKYVFVEEVTDEMIEEHLELQQREKADLSNDELERRRRITLLRTVKMPEILQNVYKSFCGVLMEIFDETNEFGTGFTIVSNFINHTLNMVQIPKNYDGLVDPITKLNKLYQKNRWGRTKPNLIKYEVMKADDADTHQETKVQIYGYVLGNRKINSQNKKLLAEAIGRRKKEVEIEAAKKALSVLHKKYGISIKIPNP